MTELVLKTDGGIVPIRESHETLASANGISLIEVDGTGVATLKDAAGSLDRVRGLIVLREPVPGDVLEALPECRSVARMGVGVDGVALDKATALGVTVTNVPSGNTEEVATHAVASILALVRRLHRFDRAVRRGTWSYLETGRGMHRPHNSVIGLLGVGRIGNMVAKMASGLGFSILGHDPGLRDDELRRLGVEPVGLDRLKGESDVISLHVPLTDATRGMVGRDFLAAMKPGAMLVNVSRGGLIDEEALADALESGHISGAALDTFAEEPLPSSSRLRADDGVLMSPHAAHYSVESETQKLTTAIEEVASVLRGGEPRYQVGPNQ